MNMQIEAFPMATLEDVYGPKFCEQAGENGLDALAVLGIRRAGNGEIPEIRVMTDEATRLSSGATRENLRHLSENDLSQVSAVAYDYSWVDRMRPPG